MWALRARLGQHGVLRASVMCVGLPAKLVTLLCATYLTVPWRALGQSPPSSSPATAPSSVVDRDEGANVWQHDTGG